MTPTTLKAFAFGVLNKAETDDTMLVIHAIVSPDLYQTHAFALDTKRNALLFDALLRVPDVAYRIAKQGLRLALPKSAPTVFLGRQVKVQLNAQPCENPEALALLQTMGTVDCGELERTRGLERVNLKRNVVPLSLPASALQDCAFRVSVEDPSVGFALRVDHVTTKDKTHIGNITLVFLPDDPNVDDHTNKRQ